MLSRIQRDLFDFTDQDPDDFPGLVEFWYLANSEALSAALTNHQGIKLIVNVRSFANFEALAKRLFLVADTLVLRDTRDWAADKAEFRAIPMPIDKYQPGFIPDVLAALSSLKPSPLTLVYRPNLYWTRDTKTLNNGLNIAYAGWNYHSIPTECLEWISGIGRDYLATGQVIYAPFVPPLDVELEFLKNEVSLPEQFGAYSLFHQRYDWLMEERLQTLLSLQIPFLDGIDIATITKVKQDNYDAFCVFSRSLIDALTNVKSSFGTESFVRELRSIQTNQIDAALSDINRAMRRINQSRALRKKGLLSGLLGLNAAAFVGVPPASLVTGLAATAAGMIAEQILRLKEQGDLSDKKGYFLWQLQDTGRAHKF